MTPQELMLSVCISVLQLEGIRADIDLFYRTGQRAELPCLIELSDKDEDDFEWLYEKHVLHTEKVAEYGRIVPSSLRASRMSLTSNFTLTINSLTPEDVGAYICRSNYKPRMESYVYVNILTVFLSPLDGDLSRNESITIQCSLWRYSGDGPCPRESIQWVDETGTVLLGEGIDYETSQSACICHLTVRLSGFNRRYTCQFVERSNRVIYAHYTPVFTEKSPVVTDCHEWTHLSLFTLILRVTGVFLMIVISLLFLKNKVSEKCRGRGNKDRQTVDYENVRTPAATANLH